MVKKYVCFFFVVLSKDVFFFKFYPSTISPLFDDTDSLGFSNGMLMHIYATF